MYTVYYVGGPANGRKECVEKLLFNIQIKVYERLISEPYWFKESLDQEITHDIKTHTYELKTVVDDNGAELHMYAHESITTPLQFLLEENCNRPRR